MPTSDETDSGKGGDSDSRFWAFISYSHQDEAAAAWLHRALEQYRLPKGVSGATSRGEVIPRRLHPVFRDRDELAGSADLGETLRSALRQSRSLIVVCSERSAKSRWVNEEVRYFQSLGRAERVFCLVVSGDVESGACFPDAVLRPPLSGGEGDRVEPLAADIRPGKDTREDALLKLIAGVLGIRFDQLKRRESRRRRLRLLRGALLTAGSIVLSVLSYLLLADLGVRLPGGDRIRLAFDRHALSVFRAPAPQDEVNAAASDLRSRLVEAMNRAQRDDGWMNQSLRPGEIHPKDAASHAQALVALFRTPEKGAWTEARLFAALMKPFLTDAEFGRSLAAKLYGDPGAEGKVAENVPGFWLVQALGGAMSGSGVVPGARRSEVLGWLRSLQDSLEAYRDPRSGGWSMFPNPGPKCPPDAYSTTLALQALLACQRAGLPWGPDEAGRDERIRTTAAWLVEHFDDGRGGWKGTGENAYEVFDGLTLQAHAVLLAAGAEAGIGLPPEILESMSALLVDCVNRDSDYPVASGEFEAEFEWYGRLRQRKEAYRFLWYPWALEAADRWLEFADRVPQPPETVYRVKRARSHLVLELGPELVDSMEKDWLFIAAETLHGLASVP